jgi:hypothetical protein
MTKQATEDIATFLKRQRPAVLVDVLLELAAQFESVNERIERLQLADRPNKLAAGFRKTLLAWSRSKKHYSYNESSAFGRELERWITQVEKEVLPMNPPLALGLFETFIESDAAWFDRADDSGGSIGDAVRSACEHWLQAARRCESPADEWPQRLVALYRGDEYGAREALLRRADLLLDEAGMRQLVAQIEKEMADMLAFHDGPQNRAGLPHGFFRLTSALTLLSEALHDPDIQVRAVCSYSPEPNGMQKESFVTAYLKENRPADALPWLENTWGHHEARRLSLLSDALERLGCSQESAHLRKQSFESSLAVHDYLRWMELLPAAEHPASHERARQLAQLHTDPCVAAQLLLAIGEPRDAQTKLIDLAERVDGRHYETLPKMAEDLAEQACFRGATVLYRALLNSILERANSVAYGHAARYWWTLREIDARCETLAPLTSRAEYEAAVQTKNRRKLGFWSQVNAQGERLASSQVSQTHKEVGQ